MLLFLLAFGGVAIFFRVGEWSRKQSGEPQLKLTNWPADAALLLGVMLFFAGGFFGEVFSLHLPSNLITLALVVAIGSIVVGLLASYVCKKLRNPEDLSL
jgi:hypothetical protein